MCVFDEFYLSIGTASVALERFDVLTDSGPGECHNADF